MKNTEKAKLSVEEAIRLLREKPYNSTLVERYFLLYEAWDALANEPQALQVGKGLYYTLSRASLPVKEYDLLLGRYDDHVPTPAEQERLDELWKRDPHTCPVVEVNGGHITLDWVSLLECGLPEYLSRAESRLSLAKECGESGNAINFLEGMVWIYKAILLYIDRYASAAEEAGLYDCAEVCEKLICGKPETFRESLQLIIFIYNVYLIYAGRSITCLNVGRLDDMLLPYYLKDLESGVLTEEDAGALIDDFSAKMSLHLGRGEHQLAYLNEDYLQTGWLRNHVYDSPGYITIGGYSNKCDQTNNPLTLLFVKHIHPELKNPVYICRFSKERHEEAWDILCEKIQKNASLIFYNDESMIPAYLHSGIEKEHAVNYTIHPCNWADISGSYRSVGMCGKPLPMIIDDVIHSSRTFDSMDDIYEAVIEEFIDICRPTFEGYRKKYLNGMQEADGVLSLNECFMAGPLETARGLKNGGAKYPFLYVLLRNIGTATDMLSAIDSLVFSEKVCTLSQLVSAADRDFEGEVDILRKCQKAPKYATGNEKADYHAVCLMNSLLDAVDREVTNDKGEREIYTLNVTINDSNHLNDGKIMNATVDGRRRGEPLSENLSGTVGYSKGVTSLLGSVSKLPFDRLHSGALNVKLHGSIAKGEDRLPIIKALLLAYFNRGGMQMQFSITDAEELRAAQADPDSYRDLLVRITGYSAVFVDISKDGQDEFIRREEMMD